VSEAPSGALTPHIPDLAVQGPRIAVRSIGSPDPALLAPGNIYRIQAWGRDQGFAAPDNTSLSNALQVPIGP
jgi:hypothetical protein